MPEMVNDVVGNDPSKLAELVKYPIPCDTQFECKRRTQFGKRKMKCQICPNQMYITSSKYYEADNHIRFVRSNGGARSFKNFSEFIL